MALAIDASTPASTTGTTTTPTSGSFSPPAGSVIFVVFRDTLATTSVTGVTDSLGSHLTWQHVGSFTDTAGVAAEDVYAAFAATAPGSMTVHATYSGSKTWYVTPIVYTGAASTQNGATATHDGTGDVSLAVTTLGAGSLGIYTGGQSNWPPVPTSPQTTTINGHSSLDASAQTLVQVSTTAAGAIGSTLTMSQTGPSNTAWGGLVVEVLAAASVVNGTCSMSATASQTVSGSAHIPGAASQSATLAQTAAGSTHVPGTASQSATLTQTAGGSSHIPGTASQTATLTQTVSGTTIIPGAASQSATLTQTVAGTVTTGPSCTMSATLTQTVSGTTVIPGACSMSATLGQTANGSAHIPGTCSMGSTLAQTVTGSTHLPGAASMTATLAQTAAGSSHIPGSVSMSATVTQTAGGSAHIPGSVSQSATLSQTVAGHVIVHGAVTMTAVLTQTVGGSPGPITVWLPTSLRLDPVKGAFLMGVNAGTATMGAGTKPAAVMGNPNPTIGQHNPKAVGAMSPDTKPVAVQGNPNPHMTLAGGS